MSAYKLTPEQAHGRKYLRPGSVMPEHLMRLLELSKIRGHKITLALVAFLVHGMKRRDVLELYDISPGYFSQRLTLVRRNSLKVMYMLPHYVGCGMTGTEENEQNTRNIPAPGGDDAHRM